MSWILLGIGAALVIGGIAWARSTTGWQWYAGAGVVLLGMLMAIIVWRIHESAPPGTAPSEDAVLLAQAPMAEPKPAPPTEPERKPVAEPPPKPPTPTPPVPPVEPVRVVADGAGGATIAFTVPGSPALLKTELGFCKAEAFYIYTPQDVPNLSIDRITPNGVLGQALTPPSWELTNRFQPYRYLLWTAPKAALVFHTGAVPAGRYTIVIRKASTRLVPGEYAPGIPVSSGL